MNADGIQIGGDHYKEMGVQPWHVMESVLTREEFIGFLKGNIIKYSMRIGKKDSDDAGKCRHYMQKLKEVEGKELSDNKYHDFIGLTQKEMDECIDGNMTITDHRLRDAVYAVVVDVEMTLVEKNTSKD